MKKNWRNYLNQLKSKKIDMQKVSFYLSRAFQKLGRVNEYILKIKGAKYFGQIFVILFCCYFVAGALALWVESFIPDPSGNYKRASLLSKRKKIKTINDFSKIFSRNLFNRKGLIPGDGSQRTYSDQSVAVKTGLPIELLGTVIFEKEEYSIATIEDKSASKTFPVRADDEIPGKMKILRVESARVTFINYKKSRKEYVEIPEDHRAKSRKNGLSSVSTGKKLKIDRVSENHFNVSRQTIDESLKDLNKVLTQARAVPNFENGMPNGYKVFQIVPGSIYDKLGLKNGDVVQGLNGEEINDPGKAFEMLNQLKSSNHVEITIKRSGKVENFSYDIN